MKFSYKNWKKVKAEKDYTLFQNNKGDELKVAHSSLSPKIRAEMAALPVHMAEGGKVEAKKDDKKLEVEKVEKEDAPIREIDFGKSKKDEPIVDFELNDSPVETSTEMAAQPAFSNPAPVAPDPIPQAAAMQTPQQPAMMQGAPAPTDQASMMAAGYGQNINAPRALMPVPSDPTGAAYATAMNKDILAHNAQLQGAQQPQAAAPALDPSRNPAAPGIAPQAAASSALPGQDLATDEMHLYQRGMSEQEQGLKKEAEAIAQQGAMEAKALEESQAAQRAIMTDYETKNKALNDEYNGVIADYKAGHIDPSAVWSSKSVPSKISTIIGILASGLGAGMSGQENMAMKVLNQEIDRDIEAQKANLSSKGNILSALSSQMGNLRSGTEMLKSIKMGIAAEEMKKAAALAKDPIAKAKLLEESGKLHQAAAPVMAKMAAQQTVNALMKQVNKDPSKAPQLFEAMRKVNPEAAKEMQGRYVPGMGFALTDNDAKELKELKGTVDTVKQGVSELQRINRKSGSSLSLEERAKAEVVAKSLVGLLRVPLTGPGAMNEGERKMLEEIVANPTKIFSLSSSNKTRLTQLTKMMDNKLETSARARGLTVASPESQLNAQQQQYVKWARANPKDQRSKLILEKLGLE